MAANKLILDRLKALTTADVKRTQPILCTWLKFTTQLIADGSNPEIVASIVEYADAGYDDVSLEPIIDAILDTMWYCVTEDLIDVYSDIDPIIETWVRHVAAIAATGDIDAAARYVRKAKVGNKAATDNEVRYVKDKLLAALPAKEWQHGTIDIV